LLAIAFFSCQPKLQPEKPQDLIPRDKMVEILHDMFIVSSAKGVNRVNFEKAGINPEQYILDKFKIDSLQFAMSNNYYAHDIDTYRSIIEDVKAKLVAEKDHFSKIEKEENEQKKRKRDSLRKVKQDMIDKGEIPSKNRIKQVD